MTTLIPSHINSSQPCWCCNTAWCFYPHLLLPLNLKRNTKRFSKFRTFNSKGYNFWKNKFQTWLLCGGFWRQQEDFFLKETVLPQLSRDHWVLHDEKQVVGFRETAEKREWMALIFIRGKPIKFLSTETERKDLPSSDSPRIHRSSFWETERRRRKRKKTK